MGKRRLRDDDRDRSVYGDQAVDRSTSVAPDYPSTYATSSTRAGAGPGYYDDTVVDRTEPGYVAARQSPAPVLDPVASTTPVREGDRDHESLATPVASARTNDEVVVPIVEEDLIVGKREVETPGGRVTTHIVEEPVQEQVTLRDETVTVNRRPADRTATDSNLTNLSDQVVEVRETDEVPVAAKQARVVEEVVVGKTASERTETVRDTVRRTDVDIQQVAHEDLEELDESHTRPNIGSRA